ncbi:hypothetical protein NBRC116188_09210 [Oceaniserpentilla sp. 4NH20-0058]|uniref:hypothetical protein n=1 Tax=Oceaniserpentilla sp. 4NH20-0058 TaxID=3127660 RepID=UPI0031092E77
MKLIVIALLVALSGCSTNQYQSIDQSQIENHALAQLPNWYHDKLGLQLHGGNKYPQNGALKTLLQQADLEFIRGNFQACQILLERAQRISTREASVYVRLSYLFWLEGNIRGAEQMARRALALVVSDQITSEEVKRLLQAIQANQY